jgi:outer membrane protein TolC
MRIAVCLLAVSAAFAQEKMPLSLKRAVEIALAPEGAARVRLAEETVHQASSRAAQARSALLPKFDASFSEANQTRNLRAFGLDFPALSGFNFPAVVGPFDVIDLRVNATQTVFDFSAIKRWQSAKTSVSAAKAESESIRDQTAAQVARAYLAVQRADTALLTARANLQLSEALLKLANSQKLAGTGTGIEVTRADVQRANDRQRLLVAENERRRAQLQLLRVMGVKLDAEIELTDPLTFQPGEISGLEQALTAARESRSELHAQDKRQAAARLNYGAAKWERLPSVGAFADYGTIGAGADSLSPTRTIGVSIRLPIFDGGRRDARRAESLSQLHQEEIRSQDLAQQVEFEVRTALDALRSAEAQVAAAREGLQLAENELAQAQRRYQAGVANSMEVTDAQTRLYRARDNQTAALYNFNLAGVDLAAATGTIQEFIRK